MRQPGQTIAEVEEDCLHLPIEVEGIEEEYVPRKRYAAVVQTVGILQVDSAVFDVVTRE